MPPPPARRAGVEASVPGAHSLRGGGRIADSDAPVPVLIHGFLGFSRLGGLEYFRGVQRQLAGLGVTPVIPQLPPLDSVRERAEALAAILAQHKAREFVLFGHSTGGLDARYLCAHLDPARRVKAVVTVGTPHLGSAEAAMMLSRWWAWPFRTVSRAALADLDPATRLRSPIPDREDVRYVSYAAARPRPEMPVLLRLISGAIAEANDGIVAVSSAKWGEYRGVLRADHLELIGWSLRWPNPRVGRPFDHLGFWHDTVGEWFGG